MSEPALSIEAIIAERVVERIRIELAPLHAKIELLERRLPPQLGDVAQACAATGLSPATVRRRMKDGSLPTVKVGARRLIDLGALRPTSPEDIAKFAREARER